MLRCGSDRVSGDANPDVIINVTYETVNDELEK